MDTWTILRLGKFLGVAVFSAGVGIAALAPDRALRSYAAWTLAPAGFLLTWLAGYGLLKATGRSMGESWVTLSILGSLLALHGTQLCARTDVPARWRAAVTWAGLGASIAAMVGRELGSGLVPFTLVAGLLSASLGLLQPPSSGGVPARVPAAFWWWMRLESLSAVALLLIYMPLKYGAGIVLDQGQGWFGWVHGVLTLTFLNGLATAARAGAWPRSEVALAFVASLIPLGGFWFEYRHARRSRLT